MDRPESESLKYFQRTSALSIDHLCELWRYRDVFIELALRDLKVQYRQTVIGVAWAIVRPVILMVVFTSLFKLMGKIPSQNPDNYAISLFVALMPWQLFSSTVTASTGSLVANEFIITKVYFPRLLLPMLATVISVVDYCVAFVVLLAMIYWHDIELAFSILLVPLLVMQTVLLSFALGTWLSASNAIYRDIGHAVPFMIQIGMFASPVVYDSQTVIPLEWHSLYYLNPMAGVLDGFRWALLQDRTFPTAPLACSFAVTLCILVTGVSYFQKIERCVADRV